MFGLTEEQIDLYNTAIRVMIEESYLPELVPKMVIMVGGNNNKNLDQMEEEADLLVQDIVSTIIFECVHASYWYLYQRYDHKKAVSSLNHALFLRMNEKLFESFLSVGISCQSKAVTSCAKNLSIEIIQTYSIVVDQTEDLNTLLNTFLDDKKKGDSDDSEES